MISRVLLLSLPAVLEIGDDYLNDGHSFHLGLAYLAATLRQQGLTVKILDSYAEDRENVRPTPAEGWQEIGLSNEKIIEAIGNFAPELIGLTIPFSCQHDVAMEILGLIRKTFPEVVVVAGGNHISAAPEKIERTLIDYLVLGEGEHSFLQLIQAINAQESTTTIPGVMAKDSSNCLPPQFIKNLDDLPLPALDLMPLQKLWGSGPRWIIMVATRGCVYNCVFCSIHTIMGRRIRRRSIDNIIVELQHWKRLYKIQEVYFEDDNLTANKKWAKELFRQITKCNLGIRFYARNGIRADTVDKEMLLLMKA
ncbi:MAG TPA: radical SAM protein, partial [Anaerolineae bacterium]|nr:radical SAM protein [Anaerolineae bacterium]